MTSRDKIGLWPLTSLVTGNLVGSGVFLLPATLAAFGTVSLLGWIATSIGAIFLALVFAQLSSTHTQTGGPYVYVRHAFGDTVGFFVCWGYWMLSWISNPALAVAAVGYLSVLVGGFSPSLHFWLELMIIAALTAFNLTGIKITGRTELVVTVLKVIPLIVLPLIGLFYIDLDNFSVLNASGKPFGAALNSVAFLTLWAFVGVETGTVPAGQVINAKRNVPMATILGTCIAALIYIIGTIVIMGVVPHADLVQSKAPYADAASLVFGGNWAIPVAVAAVVSCLGTLNGWVMVVGRIPFGAAEDGLFPKIFMRTTKHGTPYWGVLISAVCSLPLLFLTISNTLLEQFHFIIDVAVTLILIVYAVCVLAYFRILREQNKLTMFKALLGVGALGFTLWALWAASLKTVGLSLLIVLLGVPMHLYMRKKHASAASSRPSPIRRTAQR
jgi:APA family basic amino acid/polyamine antiporter